MLLREEPRALALKSGFDRMACYKSLLTNDVVEKLAKLAHSATNSLREDLKESTYSWMALSEEERNQKVCQISEILRLMPFENLGHNHEFIAHTIHNQDLAEKLKDGWRYGETPGDKQHPSILPFDALPNERKYFYVATISLVQGYIDFLRTEVDRQYIQFHEKKYEEVEPEKESDYIFLAPIGDFPKQS